MRWLFERCAEAWAYESARRFAWRGLAVYGVDGTTARVPDSPENREYFGGSLGPRGDSAYPIVRIVTLMTLRTHLLAAASFGPYARSETTYARSFWPQLPDQSLVVADRNFFDATLERRTPRSPRVGKCVRSTTSVVATSLFSSHVR
jgi:hypothetical protein